eukprot:gene18524-22112_t
MVVKDSNPNAGSGDACTANQSIDDGVEDLDDLSDKLLGPSTEKVIVQKKTILNRALKLKDNTQCHHLKVIQNGWNFYNRRHEIQDISQG